MLKNFQRNLINQVSFFLHENNSFDTIVKAFGDKMKKLYVVYSLMSLVVISGTAALINHYKPCVADGNTVCFDEETNTFSLEENAELTVYVKNSEQQDYLYMKMTRDIVDYNLKLNVEVNPEISAWDAVFELDADIFYIQQLEAAMMHDYLMEMDNRIVSQRSSTGIEHITSMINFNKTVFLPTTYEGLLFAYNKTLLEELGFDIQDVDEKNRLNALNDWQEIVDLLQQWKLERPNSSITSVFPFTVSEPWQLYAFLTAGDWHMFDSMDVSDPGFLSLDFYHSLTFIKDLFEEEWYFNGLDEKTWNYEQALINKEALFSIATEWLNWDDIAKHTNQEFGYSAFPSNESIQLSPLVRVNGLVIKENDYPSLSHKVVSILNGLDSMQLLNDTTDEDIVVAHDEFEQLTMEQKEKEKSLAYSYSVSEPLLALENNPTMLGWDFYLQGHVFEVLMKLFDNEITVEEAQLELVESYELWYNQYNK